MATMEAPRPDRPSGSQCRSLVLPRAEQDHSPLHLTREEILLLNNGTMTLEQAAATFNVDLREFKATLKDLNILAWNSPVFPRAEQHHSPYLLTREEILLRNNGSMTLEQAAATFNVDLREFKATLKDLNILAWNDVNGTKIRIHGGDYNITMYVSVGEDDTRFYPVKGWYPFQSVTRMLEEEHNLTRGFYKLSYKHSDASVGEVLIGTDRDWHDAVKYFKKFAYVMFLDLKKIPADDAQPEPLQVHTSSI